MRQATSDKKLFRLKPWIDFLNILRVLNFLRVLNVLRVLNFLNVSNKRVKGKLFVLLKTIFLFYEFRTNKLFIFEKTLLSLSSEFRIFCLKCFSFCVLNKLCRTKFSLLKKLKAFLFNLSHLTILLKIFEVMEFCIKSFLAKKLTPFRKKM